MGACDSSWSLGQLDVDRGLGERMSDTDLRELERRFRATGAVEDEATWLRGRLKAGGLSQQSLDLAAYLGHEGARAALGASAPLPHRDLHKLATTLTRDPPLALRAALAIGARLLEEQHAARGLSAAVEATRASVEGVGSVEDACGAWSNCGIELDFAAPLPTPDVEVLRLAVAHARLRKLTKECSSALRVDLSRWALGGDEHAQRGSCA